MMLRVLFLSYALCLLISSAASAQSTHQSRSFLAFSGAYSERLGAIFGLDFRHAPPEPGKIQAHASGLIYEDGYRLSLRFSKPPSEAGPNLFYGLYFEDQSLQDVLYNTRRYGLFIGQARPVGKNSSIYLQYNLFRSEVFDVSSLASPLVAADAGSVLGSGLELTYKYSKNEIGPNQRLNLSFTAGTALYGLGGDATWANAELGVKLSYKASAKTTLSVNGTYGLADALGSYELRVTDRAFLSPYAPRGFAYTGIGPVDGVSPSRTALGGEQYAVLSLELEHQFFQRKTNRYSGMIFADFGSIWDLKRTNPSFGVIDDDFSLRSSVGLALLWRGKFGTFSASYATLLKGRTTDISQPFQLQIRSKF